MRVSLRPYNSLISFVNKMKKMFKLYKSIDEAKLKIVFKVILQ